MPKNYVKRLEYLMITVLLMSGFFLGRTGARLTASGQEKKTCIVLDAGHGGADPGKVGVLGEQELLEKNINLSIVKKLKTLLENKGYEVVLTRTDEHALVPDDTPRMKVEDMHARIKVIEKAKPLLTVSIHQNSFTDPAVCGPQVFYYKESADGSTIAETMQAVLNEQLEPVAPRSSKSNDDYYLLKKSSSPTVIVECGFLSNPEEAEKLADETYQLRVARSIYLGICECL